MLVLAGCLNCAQRTGLGEVVGGFARPTTNNQCPALGNEQDLGEATILPNPMLNAVAGNKKRNMKRLQRLIKKWKQEAASLEKSENMHRKNRCYYLAEGSYQMTKQLRNCITEVELLLKEETARDFRCACKSMEEFEKCNNVCEANGSW